MDNGEVLRVVLIHEITNSSQPQLVFTFQYQGISTADSNVVNAVDGFFRNTWGPDWIDFASSDAELDRLDLSVLNLDGTVNRVLSGVNLNLVGTNLTPVLPAAVSGLIVAPTALPKQRGKKYIVGGGEGRIDNGAFNTAALNILTTLAAHYLANIAVLAAGDLVPGVLSRTLVDFVELAGAATVTNVPAYQRRRKPNVGI